MPELRYREALDRISSYVPAKSLQQIEHELGLTKIIRLAANENTMGCSPLVQVAIEQAGKDLYLYPDGFCTKLKSKVSELFNVKQEQIIFGNGSFELLSLIAQTFIYPGEESVIPEPSFGWYKVVTLSMNGVIKSIPLRNHSIDLEDIKAAVTERTKIVWLCNPNNPTGTIINKVQLEKFLQEIPSHILVVLDEAYYEYVTSEDYPQSTELLDKYSNIIILRTFSKVYGLANMRIGYGIANPEIIALLNKIRLPINVNGVAQVAALASLEDDNFKNSVLENNIRGRGYYYKNFKEMNLEYIATDTNFIMVNTYKDSIKVAGEVLKKGIALRPGTEFGMPTWLRITIGKPEENKLVIDSLKEVLNVI